MFDPLRDPEWMAAVKSIEPLDGGAGPQLGVIQAPGQGGG
jgi:hypothetical protein